MIEILNLQKTRRIERARLERLLRTLIRRYGVRKAAVTLSFVGDAAIRRPRTGGPRGHPRAPGFARTGPLRVTPGPQAHWFSDDLCANAYQVAEQSDRMGIRLRGPAIPSPAGHMLTEGVPLGAIQIPPDGQPIILFVEHQTTGGYPKPANAISADFWRLGQLRPRDEVRFERVTFEQALDLLRQQEQWLYALV